jgi:pantoate--beta-alanine ligase
MEIFYSIETLQNHLQKIKNQNKTIGFVPTMGALHAGHSSLIQAAQNNMDYVVCSIFVNPTQFNNATDLQKYPRTLTTDTELLEKLGCQVLFYPDEATMYPQGNQTDAYNFGDIETVMEGKHRPGHFAGVATIVKKLIDAVQPHRLYMGQKDYQQCAIVRSLLAHTGLEAHVKLIICPTVRHTTTDSIGNANAAGLAMSSRNVHLNPTQIHHATAIYKALQFAKNQYKNYTVQAMTHILHLHLCSHSSLRPEYIEFADAQSLQPINTWNDATSVVLCVACYAGNTRLIDNIIVF